MPESSGKPIPAQRRVDALCYLIVWLGALILLLIPDASPQLILAFCLLIAPSLFLSFPPRTRSLYRTSWHFITIAFIGLTLFDWYVHRRPLPQTLIAQMCFFQVYKAYNHKTYSDYLQMVLFSVLMVVFAGLFSSSIFFLCLLVPFVAGIAALLRSLNLTRVYLQPRRKRTRKRSMVEDGALKLQVEKKDLSFQTIRMSRLGRIVQTPALLGTALALFYLLPRSHVYSPSHFTAGVTPGGRHPVMSGLSGGMSLRHFSAIKNDPRPVLTVTFPAKIPPRETVYLRAGSLEKLQDFEWSGSAVRTALREADESGVYWFEQISPAERPLLIPHVVEYLNVARQIPVALPGLVAIDQVEARMPERRGGVVARLSFLRKYRALSWGAERPSGPQGVRENELVLARCVDLPFELQTRRLTRLASDVSYGRAGALDCARAIEQYLRSRYSYSLNIEPLNGPASGPDPIHLFLFQYKQANCEVFASAMVVLCRTLRIPARIAIGYHGGVQSDSPNVLIFRHQDAHAWAEVWSHERGWVTFDPTPPPPLEVYSGRFSFMKLHEWFGAAVSRWNQAIIWYDDEAKNRWMTYFWEPVDRWLVGNRVNMAFVGRMARRVKDNLGRPQVLALLAGLVAFNVAAAALYWELRRRLQFRLRRSHRDQVDPWFRFYRSVVESLHGDLAARRPAETPAEFLVALARARFATPDPLLPAMDFYHRGRFGDVLWSEETRAEAERLLDRLTKMTGD